jgi:riboflavin biosynthesis pyrimidine reductase
LQHFSPAAGQEFNFFSELLKDWQGWLATMVIDQLGHYAGEEGTSKDIGNPTDLQLLLALRSKASVIVTTGKTARAELYKASRFAPIAIVTRDPESLSNLPLLQHPGEHKTITLTSEKEGADAFVDFSQELESKGLKQILFEGGPSSLTKLLNSNLPVTLVLSIANLSAKDLPEPQEYSLKALLAQFLPNNQLELDNAYSVGPNVVSVWSSH